MNGLKIKNFTKDQDKNIVKEYRSGKSANQISREMKVLPQRITNCLRRNKIKPKIYYPGAKGDKNANWKGGVRMIKGYKHILIPGHRLARKDGYVAEHRLLKERGITNKKQIVHHKDKNILNNNLSNLEIYENNGKHRHYHCKTQVRNKQGKFK